MPAARTVTTPAREAQLAREWGLTLEAPYPTGSTSRVLACRRADGTPAVLKLSRDQAAVATEADALLTAVSPKLEDRLRAASWPGERPCGELTRGERAARFVATSRRP